MGGDFGDCCSHDHLQFFFLSVVLLKRCTRLEQPRWYVLQILGVNHWIKRPCCPFLCCYHHCLFFLHCTWRKPTGYLDMNSLDSCYSIENALDLFIDIQSHALVMPFSILSLSSNFFCHTFCMFWQFCWELAESIT